MVFDGVLHIVFGLFSVVFRYIMLCVVTHWIGIVWGGGGCWGKRGKGLGKEVDKGHCWGRWYGEDLGKARVRGIQKAIFWVFGKEMDRGARGGGKGGLR